MVAGPDESVSPAPGPHASGDGAAPPPRRARRVRRLAGGLLLLLLAVAALGAWFAATEAGLRGLVGLAQRALAGRLVVEAPEGRLSGPLRAGLVRFSGADLYIEIRDLALDWQPSQLLSGRLAVDRLAARSLQVARRPSVQDEPPAPPQRLTLPLAVELRRLELGAFALSELAAPAAPDAPAADGADAPVFSFTDLAAALSSDGRRHRLAALALTLPQGRAELAGELDGIAPFALSASGSFSGRQDGRAYALAFTAGETLLHPRIDLEAEGEGLQGRAEVYAAPFDPLPLRALSLTLGDVDPAAFAAGAPRAALRLEAELAMPAGGDALLSGPLRITNRSPAPIDAGGLPLTAATGRLAWRKGAVDIEQLELLLPGARAHAPAGRIGGRLSWSPPAAAGGEDEGREGAGSPAASAGLPADLPGAFGHVAAVLELAGIDTRAIDGRLPSQTVAGRIELDADATRQHALVALDVGVARIDARAELQAGPPDEAGVTPRSFSLDGRLRKVDPRALLPSAPSAVLNLDVEAHGTLAPRTELQAKFGLPGSRFEGRPLGGTGAFRYTATDGAFRVADVALALELAGNRLQASGDWGGQGDRLALRLDAPALSAIGYGLGGRAGAEGMLAGSLAKPAGNLIFFGSALRLPGTLSLAGVNGEARLDAGVDGPFRLSVGLSGLASTAPQDDGKAGERQVLVDSAYLTAEGTRAAHTLLLRATGLESDRLDLRLQGGLTTVKRAAATSAGGGETLGWAGELAALETGGRVSARLAAPASLELSAGRIGLGAAELAVGEQGRIRLQETRWTPSASVARGSLTGLVVDLRPRDAARTTAARAGRGERPRRGAGLLTLGAEWNLRAGDTLEGEARVFRESGDISVEGEIRTRLGLESLEARLAARDDRLALSWEASGSEFGRVVGSASLRAERSGKGAWRIAPQAPLTGAARLDMPSITWLGRLMRENVETAGSLKGEFTLAGTVAEPLASGRIDGRGLQLALVDQGLVLSGGELDMSFDRDRLRLDRLAFVSPNRVRPRDDRVPFERLTATPGTLTASGEILLGTGAGEFSFRADRLPLLQRADRWLIVSGSGSGRSTWTSLDLQADFRADAGYLEFAEAPPPSLGDDVVVLGREEKAGSFGVRADLRVALGDALYLSAMGLDTRLSGELRLRQQPGLPLSAVGTVATVGGSYRGYGQRLSIERGLVNFQGALDDPGLNVVALRKGLEVEAGVEILGSARRPKVRLVSEPSVPDPEKLSWIVLGRAPDAASGADLGLLLPAAQALLGGPGGGMTDELSRSLGFDSFSIGQGELNSASRTATSRVVGGGARIASGPTVAGQVLSVGKRLGSDLFLSFEQSLGGAETLVKLTYQLSRRLALIARGGTDNSLDLHYSFSFR
ncbi:translocation/assembly module TamB domain-containing protein [Thauera sinica]|uniref:Translocation/assembly module TamB domain-containing protein n=1 Tax=Thauera sinica TaxID=2665146 RepID=A0ABW1AXP3_9RHOO|nr:translocation/assembly module TamB domain-containing protein [Thauera sp. K11]ATE58773.1 DUF490 domain-containing protein [Thauera sp. K11]